MSPEVRRRPRRCKHGAKLTVLKQNGRWHVLYVTDIDERGMVWHWAMPGVTADWHRQPFASWGDAMAYAATLRTYYGDQRRGDDLLWNLAHAKAGASRD